MIKGTDVRHADHPIDALFLDRWSPRAMSGQELSEEELMTLFEAARWAPSSGNAQPWRMLYARRSAPAWAAFLGLLTESNRIWAARAAALVLFVSRSIDDRGRATITHSYDTGAAWGFFALQGYLKGYVVHGMQGFDYERARTELDIPAPFRIEAMAAIGKPAPKETLPEALQAREVPNGRRVLDETVFEGRWRSI